MGPINSSRTTSSLQNNLMDIDILLRLLNILSYASGYSKTNQNHDYIRVECSFQTMLFLVVKTKMPSLNFYQKALDVMRINLPSNGKYQVKLKRRLCLTRITFKKIYSILTLCYHIQKHNFCIFLLSNSLGLLYY